jgi:hypothetical protein
MKLGITTIQRNRGPWIVQWLAFHLMVGFDKFFFYAHKCTDDTIDILIKLQRHYDITIHELGDMEKPQLIAYKHAIDTYGHDVDWMAFIDGDEFLFSPRHRDMEEALAEYAERDLSALAVYWMCYGSNGHLDEPDGLLLENYPRHGGKDLLINKHIKSIVRGGEDILEGSSHYFVTSRGTFDELMRPVTAGVTKYEPSQEIFRINHYACQSHQYFMRTKGPMGEADGDPNKVRGLDHFFSHDRNECDDGVSYNLLIPLKLKVRELQAVIDSQAGIVA